MATLKPVNQKSVYHSWGDLYVKIMNEEVDPIRAEAAIGALQGMNRTFALEVKRAEVTREAMRVVEIKNFEEQNGN